MPWPRKALTKLLSIEHPIIQAPMAGVSTTVGNAQRPEVGNLQHDPVALGLRGAQRQAQLDLGEQPLRRLARGFPELNERRGVEACEANLVRETRLHGSDVGVDGRGAARKAQGRVVVRVCLACRRVIRIASGAIPL